MQSKYIANVLSANCHNRSYFGMHYDIDKLLIIFHLPLILVHLPSHLSVTLHTQTFLLCAWPNETLPFRHLKQTCATK